MQMEQLRNTAEPIAEGIALLMGTWVSVLDQYGLELAWSNSGFQQANGHLRKEHGSPYVTAQLSLQNEPVKVLVGEPSHSQPASRNVALRLISIVARQYISPPDEGEDHDARSGLVAALISEKAGEDKALLREARRLKIDLNTRRCLLLVNTKRHALISGNGHNGQNGHSTESKEWPAELIVDVLSDLFNKENDALCGRAGPGQYVVLKAIHADHMVKWIKNGDLHRYGENWVTLQVAKTIGHSLLSYLDNEIGIQANIAVGRQYQGINGLSLSYKDAETAMRVGLSLLTYNPRSVFSLDELGFDTLAWIPDAALKLEFAQRLLSPLDPDPELVKTLQTFFEGNCGAAATSQRLNLHRNSLYYRLDKIAGLVGLDPRKIDQAAILHLCMRLCEQYPHLAAAEQPVLAQT